MDTKKPLLQVVAEIMKHMIDEKLTPEEILMITRQIENEAMIALTAERFANTEEKNE
jgi:predicted LPLAT superfamily acyltransferase